MDHQTTHALRKPAPRNSQLRRLRLGVTIIELMVVIGIIVLLMAILMPALRAVRTQTFTTSSMNNLRQIATFMRAYERDNRATILPSQFDYSSNVFTHKGKVRMAVDGAAAPQTGQWHTGSWADILWTINEIGVFPAAVSQLGHDYRYDAPDKALYDVINGTINNPFRAAMDNTRDFRPSAGTPGDGIAKPHGEGAHEAGYPGFFAANDFFSVVPSADHPTGRWWSTGQIRAPERSMYLVDSFAGEVIAPVEESYNNVPGAGGHRSIEVDFRYSSSALMLMLDGSIRPVGQWQTLEDLETQRAIRIRELDKHALDQ